MIQIIKGKIPSKSNCYKIVTIKGHASLPNFCCLCGQRPVDAAHLLPKSEYPEHYTKEWNIVPLCRTCHNMYDSDRKFRREQKKLVEIVKEHDELAANRYFGL